MLPIYESKNVHMNPYSKRNIKGVSKISTNSGGIHANIFCKILEI